MGVRFGKIEVPKGGAIARIGTEKGIVDTTGMSIEDKAALGVPDVPAAKADTASVVQSKRDVIQEIIENITGTTKKINALKPQIKTSRNKVNAIRGEKYL